MVEDGRERLRSNPYPGRGFILGLDASGRYALQIYFITARSAGSKNRILEIEGEDVRTQPFDRAERSDDPNIWYRAIAHAGDRHVVSNGVHTDLIIDYLGSGRGFWDAVQQTSFETDAPNFTPRIAGMTDLADGRCETSFAMVSRTPTGKAKHDIYGYDPKPGTGHCFHTYTGDGNPVPAYTGRPYEIELPGTPDEIMAGIWDNLLPADKRVAIALKIIDLESRQIVALKVTNTLG
jgi:hypothetical protein